MKVTALNDTDVKLIERDSFEDDRGSFTRLFCEDTFKAYGLPIHFPHMNFSENRAVGTLRGMHYQVAPHGEGKLIFCVSGSIFDAAADMRPDSKTYLKWVGLELSAHKKNSLYIPPGFAHGFLTLESETKVVYLSTTPYHAASEKGVHYLDPAIGIEWPKVATSVSEKDKNWQYL